jgi:uracil-DNA glycosylase
LIDLEQIPSDWREALSPEFSKPYFQELQSFLAEAYQNGRVYPPAPYLMRAFACTPLHSVKVVILGQDPYHSEGQANGLAFSVNDGVKFPPSLRNIFKEIQRDLGIEIPFGGSLERWSEQGVLLLNATLSVEAGRPGSHQNIGWEPFTDAAIEALRARSEIVYMLWGSFALKKAGNIDQNRNLVLTSPHPSPLSAYRGFNGNGHFSKTNKYLQSKGLTPINW